MLKYGKFAASPNTNVTRSRGDNGSPHSSFSFFPIISNGWLSIRNRSTCLGSPSFRNEMSSNVWSREDQKMQPAFIARQEEKEASRLAGKRGMYVRPAWSKWRNSAAREKRKEERELTQWTWHPTAAAQACKAAFKCPLTFYPRPVYRRCLARVYRPRQFPFSHYRIAGRVEENNGRKRGNFFPFSRSILLTRFRLRSTLQINLIAFQKKGRRYFDRDLLSSGNATLYRATRIKLLFYDWWKIAFAIKNGAIFVIINVRFYWKRSIGMVLSLKSNRYIITTVETRRNYPIKRATLEL